VIQVNSRGLEEGKKQRGEEGACEPSVDLLGLVPQLEGEGRRRARAGAAGPPLLLRGGGRRERDGARTVHGPLLSAARSTCPSWAAQAGMEMAEDNVVLVDGYTVRDK
jgi:hypothetical protein